MLKNAPMFKRIDPKNKMKVGVGAAGSATRSLAGCKLLLASPSSLALVQPAPAASAFKRGQE